MCRIKTGPVLSSSTKRFAQKYFPGRDPIGLHIDDNQREDSDNPQVASKYPPLTIVGVVPRTRNEAPGEDNVEKLGFVHMYFSSEQNPSSNYSLMLRVTNGDPKKLVPLIRREVQAIDSAQPIGAVSTMDDNIAASLSTRRLTMSLLGTFASLALLLASIGLYGVMALSVTQRTRELGIRLALGAQRADVFRLVSTREWFWFRSASSSVFWLRLARVADCRASLWRGRFDAPAISFALFALALVALIACWLPARRATRVDPIVALRAE